jgi:hypothetical protein
MAKALVSDGIVSRRLKAPLPWPFEAQGKLKVRGFHQRGSGWDVWPDADSVRPLWLQGKAVLLFLMLQGGADEGGEERVGL